MRAIVEVNKEKKKGVRIEGGRKARRKCGERGEGR